MPQQVAIPLEKRKMANYGTIRRMEADEQLSFNGLIPFDRSYLLWDKLALKLDGDQPPNWRSVASLLGFPFERMNWIPNLDQSAGMTPCMKFFYYYVKNWPDQSVQSMMIALWQAGLYDALKILEEGYPSIDVKQIAQDKGLSQDVFIPKKVEELEELDDAPKFSPVIRERPERNNHCFPASHHPGAMYHFSGLVHLNNINENNGDMHQYGHKDNISNPRMDLEHSLVHDIQPMFNGQGGNQQLVICGDCENCDENYNDADVADTEYRKQEKVGFITHKENEHHCSRTENLPAQHNHVQTKQGEQSYDLEHHHYACISRNYLGCKSHSRSPLDDMAAMRQGLAQTVSQQDCKMAEFKTKNPTKIRICVLAMDDLTMESKKSFYHDLRSTQYSDVVFCPVFVSHKDDQKRIQTYLDKSDTIIWCGSAKLKQMLEGTLSTAYKYNLLRYTFHNSLRYKNKLIRVVFPEQPNSQETFPLQVIYKGKLFMYREDWDDLTYYLSQPKQVMEKIAKTYQKLEMMGKKPHDSKF